MMQWLFTIKVNRPGMLKDGPTQAEADSVGRHFGYWHKLAEREVALVVGRTQTTDPLTIGIAIFRTETEGEARQIAEADPAVIDGVFRMELRPFKVAILGNSAPFKP
jgi:uncharacterized protein YciI